MGGVPGAASRGLAEDPTGSFSLCRIGEALGALGRHTEALDYLTRALRKHEQELRADTASLFNRLAVVEDRGRICKILASLGKPDAPATCGRATAFAGAITVDPSHAFPRAFLALVWSEMGSAYEMLAGRHHRRGGSAGLSVAARDRYRRSHEIWADLRRAVW